VVLYLLTSGDLPHGPACKQAIPIESAADSTNGRKREPRRLMHRRFLALKSTAMFQLASQRRVQYFSPAMFETVKTEIATASQKLTHLRRFL